MLTASADRLRLGNIYEIQPQKSIAKMIMRISVHSLSMGVYSLTEDGFPSTLDLNA